MMKKILVFASLSLFAAFSQAQDSKKEIGNLVIEGIPEIAPSIKERMNQYQNTRSASFSSWAPDGKSMIISTRFGETAQLHLLQNPGGARKQITFFKEPIPGGTFCPLEEKNGFMFTKDMGGNEFSQLFWFDINTGNHELISDGGRTQNSLPRWSSSGKEFITVSTKRNGKDYDLYLCQTTNPKDYKLILQEGGSWSVMDWSPDDKQLLVRNRISANKSFIYLLDITTGKLEQINPSKEEISYTDGLFGKDGKGIFIVNDEGSEFQVLKHYNIATKKFTALSTNIPWDVEDIVMDKTRQTLIASVNENGFSKLFQVDVSNNSLKAIEGLPIGIFSGLKFNPKTNELAMTINGPTSPGDVYTLNLQSNKLTQWTFSEAGGLDNTAFVAPSLIHFPTFDMDGKKQRMAPAFFYKPKQTNGKIPVVINIHGGPEAQFRPGFNSFISYMNNELGIAVIAPNVRGSSGYGKTYLKLDNGFKREESVKDIGALLDWIAKQPELDASRVAVLGGSYGGYMVLASMAHYNDRLKCGIDIVGISNFVTFLKNTEDYRKDLRRVEYGDEREPKMREFLEKISPTNNVEKINKPLFIIQGLNDPRVPASEAEQMRDKVKEKGGDVWYLMAKDEGHGFRKKNNSDYMQWSIVTFLNEKLVK
jgi:dipeptidyl aminopeptidase/acylaminoacyl peptidase